MLKSSFESRKDILKTTVEGDTPNTELIQWLSDLPKEHGDRDQLFILLDMRTARIRFDLRFYSFDMNDAMDLFRDKLGGFSKIAVANIIKEDDDTNRVLIMQFSKLQKQVPSYITSIFHDIESAEKWLLEQQSS
jgi:hypothetical protein